jgi:antitoxin HicB
MTMFAYPVDLSKDTNGTILAVVPDVQGCHTFGDTGAEALARAVDALESALAHVIDRNLDLPPPSPARGRPVVVPSVRATLKLHIYDAMRRRGVRKAELARRLKVKPFQVERLLDLMHNSTIDQLDAALRALGVRIKTMEAA